MQHWNRLWICSFRVIHDILNFHGWAVKYKPTTTVDHQPDTQLVTNGRHDQHDVEVVARFAHEVLPDGLLGRSVSEKKGWKNVIKNLK